jgi:thioredoxin-related protein
VNKFLGRTRNFDIDHAWRVAKKNSQYCLVVFGYSGEGKSVCKRLKGVISVDGNNKEAVMASYILDKISRIPISGTS